MPFVFIRLVVGNFLDNPCEQLLMRLDYVLAVQSANNSELSPADDKAGGELLGKVDGTIFSLYDRVQDEAERLREIRETKINHDASQ